MSSLIEFGQRAFAVRSFGRFALVGGVNTMVGLGTFPLLYHLFPAAGVNLLLVASYGICTVFAFTFHTLVTFEERKDLARKAIKYVGLCGMNYVVNAIALNGFLYLFPIYPVAPQLVIAVLLQVANYQLMRRFIYRDGEGSEAGGGRSAQ